MARNADSELAEATSFKKEIVSTGYVIRKLKEAKTDEGKLAAAREMVNRLENELNSLSEELLTLDKAYIEYKAQSYITFNYYEQSFLQRIGIKKIAEETAILLLLLAAGLYIKTVREERKKNEEV